MSCMYITGTGEPSPQSPQGRHHSPLFMPPTFTEYGKLSKHNQHLLWFRYEVLFLKKTKINIHVLKACLLAVFTF